MKRGRKSAEDLQQVVLLQGSRDRPPAPDELVEREAEIWDAVVRSEVDGYFATAALQGMLADYCRHRASADMVSEVIGMFESAWLKNSDGVRRYRDLIRMREIETRSATSIATKLRLTNQSRYTPQAAGTSHRNMARTAKPWEQ